MRASGGGVLVGRSQPVVGRDRPSPEVRESQHVAARCPVEAQESCQVYRIRPEFFFWGRDPSKIEKIEAIQGHSCHKATILRNEAHGTEAGGLTQPCPPDRLG